MKPLDPQHIRFVTRRFGDLQGLKHAPLMLYSLPWCLLGVRGPWNVAGLLLSVVSIVLQPFLVARAKAYYKARIGQVIATPMLPTYQLSVFSPGGAISGIQQDLRFRWIFLGGYISVIALSIWMARSHAVKTLAAVAYLFDGTALIAIWLTRREHRLSQLHYAIVGTLSVALAWCANVGAWPNSLGQVHNAISIIGCFGLVCCLLDHRELMNTFGWPSPEP